MSTRPADLTIIIRGAGEMASGVAHRLHRSGFTRLLMTDIDNPLAVRRLVSFCEALHYKTWRVEDLRSARIESPEEAEGLWKERIIPVIVDPDNRSKDVLGPDVVVDAILAKKNLGTTMSDAPLVLGLGPGFCAGKDVHWVVETNRGHNLGRLIFDGEASPNTGVPGDIAGQTSGRVLRAPVEGIFQSDVQIGTQVREGLVVGHVGGHEVRAGVAGVVRGLIRPGTAVVQGIKIGDVDPRSDVSYCSTISEKARAIGGTVLEAILIRFNKPRQTG
ncbi:MAG: selenium-dependent molybdenum cofactor biosynthesis protein YqeB [Pseudomonadota bacterium]